VNYTSIIYLKLCECHHLHRAGPLESQADGFVLSADIWILSVVNVTRNNGYDTAGHSGVLLALLAVSRSTAHSVSAASLLVRLYFVPTVIR